MVLEESASGSGLDTPEAGMVMCEDGSIISVNAAIESNVAACLKAFLVGLVLMKLLQLDLTLAVSLALLSGVASDS